MDETQSKPTPLQIAAGGETVESPSGPLFVRQIAASELMAYLRAEAEGEEAVLRMVVRSIDGSSVDIGALDLDTYEALIEADQRQNFTHARRREAREAERAARMLENLREQNPALAQRLETEQARLLALMLSSAVPSPSGSGAGESAPPKPPSLS